MCHRSFADTSFCTDRCAHSTYQRARCVLQNPLGMPRVSRTMNQVQQLSEKMVSRVQHRDTATDGLASARLLAQQGLNQRQ